ELGELRDRQSEHGDKADDHRNDRNDHCNDRPVDEEFGHGVYLGSDFAVGSVLASGIALNGFGSTVMPAFTRWVPSATTFSPGFNPSSMIHSVPTRSPTLTGRMLTLLSLPTT